MADSTEQPIVLHSQQQVALPAQRTGPLVSMVADALSLAAIREPLSIAARPAILLVDEDRSLLQYLAELLGPHFSIVCTSDADEALAFIAESDFDVLVASAILSGIESGEFYSRAKAAKSHLAERFIFTTTNEQNSPAVPAIYLRKPVRLDQWDQAILAILKKTRPMQFRSRESIFLL